MTAAPSAVGRVVPCTRCAHCSLPRTSGARDDTPDRRRDRSLAENTPRRPRDGSKRAPERLASHLPEADERDEHARLRLVRVDAVREADVDHPALAVGDDADPAADLEEFLAEPVIARLERAVIALGEAQQQAAVHLLKGAVGDVPVAEAHPAAAA